MIKLICFDLNKTLITKNVWPELNEALGIKLYEDDFLHNLYQNEIITYPVWQDLLLKLYLQRGKPTRSQVEKSLFNYEYKPDVKTMINYLKLKDYQLAIITASLQSLAERVAAELKIPYAFGLNRFIYDNAGYLTDMKSIQTDEETAKLEQLVKLCKQLKVKPTECACVGDGANDRKLFIETGNGITFTGSKLEEISWKTIGGLKGLMELF